MSVNCMPEKNSAWRSPWVIGWSALILVVFLVNLLMIYLAISGNPGLVVEDYYERGQDYEQNMVARMEKNPGWLMRVEMPDNPIQGVALPIRFVLSTKDGAQVDPDSVAFHAYRPSDAKQDFAVTMQQQIPGTYLADVTFPLKGVWDVLVSVQKDGEEYNEAIRVNIAAGN